MALRPARVVLPLLLISNSSPPEASRDLSLTASSAPWLVFRPFGHGYWKNSVIPETAYRPHEEGIVFLTSFFL